MTMNKITPHLWYDKEAREAAEFYTSAFKGIRPRQTGLEDQVHGDDSRHPFGHGGYRHH